MVSERRGPDRAVVPLPAEPLLARTVEVVLYYRRGRVAELTGLDFSDGEHRLLLHGSPKAALLRS